MTDLVQLQQIINMNKELVQGLLDSGHHLVAAPGCTFFVAMTDQHDPFTTCAGAPYHFFIKKEEIDGYFRNDNLSP